MHLETRSGWQTIFWLTVYVAAAPLLSIMGLMWLSHRLGATDEGWAGLFALGYAVMVWLGAHRFAAHFERHP